MAYLRQGQCLRCRECCGSPRSTDGGRNNPWPVTLVSDIRTWSPADVEFNLPIFKFIDRAKQSGRLRVGDVNSAYVFSTQTSTEGSGLPLKDEYEFHLRALAVVA